MPRAREMEIVNRMAVRVSKDREQGHGVARCTGWLKQ